MEPPRRNASYQPTVKCSTCAADIDFSTVTEHVCLQYAPVVHHQPYPDHFQLPVSHPQYDQTRELAPLSGHRPTLPKLDASVNNRSGLRPNEAASIAHDLGLPSPPSAGSSRSPHRSRSKTRKPLVTRPPSPDGPIGQDCAFPPFPTKSKRTQPEKEIRTHKPHSTSRSTTSTRTGQHSSSLSNASSVYSNGSGPTKRRTSNTSSNHRSRQGTIDDGISIPSTTPSSPHYSTHSSFGREQSMDQSHGLPALVPSDNYASSAPNSSVSSMPPTPSWPPEAKELSPKVVQVSNSEVGWTPTERSIPEEHLPEVEIRGHTKQSRNQLETFDRILSSEQLKQGGPMFDNPPKEPLYRTKRPAPLLPTKQYIDDASGMPLSARMPPPPPPTGGLSRTLNNLFGRKRSKSTAAANVPLHSFDSPRIRALAPDPPERPKRGASLWDDATPTDEHQKDQSDPLLSHGKIAGDWVTTGVNNHEDTHIERKVLRETGDFNFEFAAEQSTEPSAGANGKDNPRGPELDQDAAFNTMPTITNSEFEKIGQDLRRASIDSASSYGSIGFSTNRTISSRTSPPTSSAGIADIITTILEPEQPSTSTFEFALPERLQDDELVPESPTDPLYHAGKLSPVPEGELLDWPQNLESKQVPERNLSPLQPRSDTVRLFQDSELESLPTRILISPLPRSDSIRQPRTSESENLPDPTIRSPLPRSNTRGSSRSARPETPAAVKGTCRGCSQFIMTGQKSVASADGRLTGRYHKECFACQTCKEAFATADFYVYDDHPYCAHHYHTLNNTLCIGCGKGIEGQYLETFDVTGSTSKKFHPKCLQCTTCKTQLDEDYFEFHGRVYCERDAFRAASGPRNPYDTVPSRPSPLVREYINSEEPGLKGRFPERRTTRLIMN